VILNPLFFDNQAKIGFRLTAQKKHMMIRVDYRFVFVAPSLLFPRATATMLLPRRSVRAKRLLPGACPRVVFMFKGVTRLCVGGGKCEGLQLY